MLAKKPVIAIFAEKELIRNNSFNEDLMFNAFPGENEKTYSFRCPACGRPVKVGFIACPFCNQRLKWIYPFKYIGYKEV